MGERVRSPRRHAAQYTIADDQMAAGSTLGSPKATLLLKSTGAIEKLYSPEFGVEVFGTLVLHHWDAISGVPLTPRTGTFEIYPAHQRHRFELSNGVAVSENVFLLSGVPLGHQVDPPAAYYVAEMRNETGSAVRVGTLASVRLRGGEGGTTWARYDTAARGFVVANDAQPDLVRVASSEPAADSYEVTLDAAKTSALHYPGTLSGTEQRTPDDPIGIFHFERTIKPGECVRYEFALTFSGEGEAAAIRLSNRLPRASEAFERTREHYESIMDRAIVYTPDDEVNRGVLWAKANVLRVQNLTREGWCFTNDPARSNNSVGRDTAWYALGADFVTPDFTREALLWYLDHLEPTGMVVEYFDIRNGASEDYGLNINDNTPLLVLALWHHYCVTGNREFLEYVYSRLHRVAAYILSQRNAQGLVWCRAGGTADYGIVGWRNVIDGYRLSGATTEVNSECYAALSTMAHMASEMNDDARKEVYAREAEDLKRAINEHLLDKSRNLYYLNIDLDGTARTDVTCDLVFPILFGVADRDVAANILARLSSAEFWSDAGMHTVPRNDINYSPTRGAGLMGGIWGGPTFWFASASSSFNPQFMAYALSSSFAHYTSDPRRNNTVPGQFCEWLHGETMTNQGMMLSPWFAPKYLWAAIEGAAGLELNPEGPRLEARLGNMWRWIAVRKASVRGADATWIMALLDESKIYATRGLGNVHPENVYDQDVSDGVEVRGDTAVCVALERADSCVLFVGNTLDRTVNVGLAFRTKAMRRATLRSYNTLRREWIEERDFDLERLARGFPIQVSRHGFCILELHKAA